MITLYEKLDLLERLRVDLQHNEEWNLIKTRAFEENGWFVAPFTDLAIANIINEFLDAGKLANWIKSYGIPANRTTPKTIGLVMAGNIPLVGFHDFLCGFLSGHKLLVKPSSKDNALIRHVVKKLAEWDERINEAVVFAERLKNCDAYIATGSNNSGRYFEYYFRNYPSIIRKNRTSVAVLSGSERSTDLQNLADDMLLYFGLGCRNVSKIYVPRDYDFIPLLHAMDKYMWMEDHSKFKNNYDYNLSLHILNHQYYMTNGTVLLVENPFIFSPISQVNFEFYDDNAPTDLSLKFADQIQCVAGSADMTFGKAQFPSLTDYADGVDTLKFLSEL